MFSMVSSRLIIQLSLSTDWNNSVASPYSVKSFSEPFNNVSILHMHELSGLTIPCNGFKTNVLQQLQTGCESEAVYSLFQWFVWVFFPIHNFRYLLVQRMGQIQNTGMNTPRGRMLLHWHTTETTTWSEHQLLTKEVWLTGGSTL